jgi:hypothetical protein
MYLARTLYEAGVQAAQVGSANDGTCSLIPGFPDHAKRRIEIRGAVIHPRKHVRVCVDDIRGRASLQFGLNYSAAGADNDYIPRTFGRKVYGNGLNGAPGR